MEVQEVKLQTLDEVEEVEETAGSGVLGSPRARSGLQVAPDIQNVASE